jgi:hypothetical protein
MSAAMIDTIAAFVVGGLVGAIAGGIVALIVHR